MSFSAEWLALREPLDHASVNADLRAALAERFAGRERLAVVDLGCGAGSNLRGLAPALPPRQDWRLVDYDARLLAAARERLAVWADGAEAAGEGLRLRRGGLRLDVAFRQADFGPGYDPALFAGADLVTAAALYDLASVENIRSLAAAVAAAGAAFFTVLTYDGLARFEPPHPVDGAIRAAFNRHQRTDKGLGPAAGPDATDALAAAFEAQGYRVRRGPSPWVADERFAALRRELDAGFAGAARELGGVPEREIEAWLAHREATGCVTIVGHEDLLAVPA